MKTPIQSKKHYVQRSLLTVLAGTNLAMEIAHGVTVPVATNSFDVIEGSVIKAVFVEMWCRSQEISPGSVLLTLIKEQGGSSITFAEQINLNQYTNKKNVFYHTQGLTNDSNADAIPFLRQWFKIPKGKQRFGLGDNLQLGIAAQALDCNICGFATYKEFT